MEVFKVVRMLLVVHVIKEIEILLLFCRIIDPVVSVYCDIVEVSLLVPFTPKRSQYSELGEGSVGKT